MNPRWKIQTMIENDNETIQQSNLDLISACTRATLYLVSLAPQESEITDSLPSKLIPLLINAEAASNEDYAQSVITGIEGEFNSTLLADSNIALNQVTNQLGFLSRNDKMKARKFLNNLSVEIEKTTTSGGFFPAIDHFYKLTNLND